MQPNVQLGTAEVIDLDPWFPGDLFCGIPSRPIAESFEDERDLGAQVKIPRSWGSLRDLPSPTSSYCTDYSGPKGTWVEIMADFS